MTLVFLALILFIWLYAYSILSKESIEKRYRKQQKEREACILAEACPPRRIWKIKNNFYITLIYNLVKVHKRTLSDQDRLNLVES